MSGASVLAIDVGSSRVKLGWYGCENGLSSRSDDRCPTASRGKLRVPDASFQVVHRGEPADRWTDLLAGWAAELPRERDALCLVAAVHPAAAATCIERLVALGWPHATSLTSQSLPIRVQLTEPQRVGVDRLLGCVAANLMRAPGKPAIVVDMGTAITVDLLAGDGSFSGGAILPGTSLGASALHLGTASLPIVSVDANSPPCVGRSTIEAMVAGLHWGTIGGVVELIRRISDAQRGIDQVFLTGGDAPRVVSALEERLPQEICHFPFLVLSGIYAAAMFQGGVTPLTS